MTTAITRRVTASLLYYELHYELYYEQNSRTHLLLNFKTVNRPLRAAEWNLPLGLPQTYLSLRTCHFTNLSFPNATRVRLPDHREAGLHQLLRRASPNPVFTPF